MFMFVLVNFCALLRALRTLNSSLFEKVSRINCTDEFEEGLRNNNPDYYISLEPLEQLVTLDANKNNGALQTIQEEHEGDSNELTEMGENTMFHKLKLPPDVPDQLLKETEIKQLIKEPCQLDAVQKSLLPKILPVRQKTTNMIVNDGTKIISTSSEGSYVEKDITKKFLKDVVNPSENSLILYPSLSTEAISRMSPDKQDEKRNKDQIFIYHNRTYKENKFYSPKELYHLKKRKGL